MRVGKRKFPRLRISHFRTPLRRGFLKAFGGPLSQHHIGNANLGWRCHQLRYVWTRSPHGNGVADSLPSGSGNLDVQLGRERLPFPLALRKLDSSWRPVKYLFRVTVLPRDKFSDGDRDSDVSCVLVGFLQAYAPI